jgi:hypothetical protein
MNMARKATGTSKSSTVKKSATTTESVTVTPVRNSAIPPKAAIAAIPSARVSPTHDQIALTAYFIWQSNGGSQDDNWFRALREMGV